MSKRILIIDDEQLLLDLLTHLLSQIGYEVDQALSGREAAAKMKDREYDIIFLDIRMPQMDGKEFYLRIRERSPSLAGRIVFITGDVANPQTVSFIEETGNLYLKKPFTIREVQELLEKLFGKD